MPTGRHVDNLYYYISRVPTEFRNWGYNCCFFLNFVPLHIESPYNFGGTGPILGVKNPLERVNRHADKALFYCFSVGQKQYT